MAQSAAQQLHHSSRRASRIPAAQLAEELNNQANALLAQGDVDRALSVYREAAGRASNLPGIPYNIGNALQRLGRHKEAVRAYQRAIAIAPDFAEAHNNQGNALRALGREQDAVGCFRRALELRPQYPDALYNLGTAQLAAGQVDDAIDALEAALSLAPEFAEGHFNLALALLLKGDYKRGWPEYEWRWHCASSLGLRVRQLSRPIWNGQDLSGRTILLHTEQGFGDSIQFVRYAQAVRGKRHPKKIIVLCEPELKSLLETARGVDHVVTNPELCDFDTHAPLVSLPYLLGSRGPLPAAKPYLATAPASRARWKRTLADVNGIKVGIAWAGRLGTAKERRRALPDAALATLTNVPGVTFVSLQPGGSMAPRVHVEHLGGGPTDFADTAAAIEQLDLVVSIDTASAHLAGALGKRVWLLLPSIPNWRWQLTGQVTPWYPTFRLFRQSVEGEWDAVIERVRQGLATLVQHQATATEIRSPSTAQ